MAEGMFKGEIEADNQRKPIEMGGRISGRNERSGGWEDDMGGGCGLEQEGCD